MILYFHDTPKKIEIQVAANRSNIDTIESIENYLKKKIGMLCLRQMVASKVLNIYYHYLKDIQRIKKLKKHVTIECAIL